MGSRNVLWHGEKAINDALRQLEKNMNHVGNVLAGEMRYSIQKSPASGNVYKRRGIEHQASAPGEPPATDRGQLAQSIDYTVEQTGKYKFKLTVGTKLKYGKWLEYGTLDEKILPRPFARPALKKYEKKLDEMTYKDVFE